MIGRKIYNTFIKAVSATLACLCVIGVSVGCANGSQDNRPKLVFSTFVLYDWAKNVLGEDADKYDMRILGANGADIHSYQPTVSEISLLSECKAFFHIGGKSDEWVDEILKTVPSEERARVDFAELLISDGELPAGHEDHAEEHLADEHIWFSFDHVCYAIEKTASELGKLSPDRADTYEKNAASYCESVRALGLEYKAAADNAKTKNVVVADRYPFYYLFSELFITAHTAFEGCSAESEASFEVISKLSAKLDEFKLGCVIVCEGSDKKIAQTVIDNSSRKEARILTLNSMQSVTQNDIENGASYLSILESNLEVFKLALS